MRPLADRVVVRREAEIEKTASGLYIPEVGKEKPANGVVVAIGAGTYRGDKLVPLDVKVGDKILFGKYAGTETTIDLDKVVILREDEIMVVLD